MSPDAPGELLIVAGAITDSFELPRLLLAARRTAPEWAHGMWEFAGGKVESGETVVEGLHRELAEELGVDVVVGDELRGPDVSAATGDAVWEIRAAGFIPAPGVEPSPLRFVMRLFWCELAPGSERPEPLEDHDQLRWLEPGSWLDGVPWLPADERIVAALLNDAVARHRRAVC
ncbi:MAG TPA: NUDIX domain-containing protein [Demequina sp.]|nr:NUDIX domain-containing protein [Demequina sp.]